jgi:hypothetical protein
MGFLSKLFLGNHLTNLANTFEEVLNAGGMPTATTDIHANVYSPFTCLSLTRQAQIKFNMPKRMTAFRKQPRHVITRELLKNMQVAYSFRRERRLLAYQLTLWYLVEQDVALDLDTFNQSYGR